MCRYSRYKFSPPGLSFIYILFQFSTTFCLIARITHTRLLSQVTFTGSLKSRPRRVSLAIFVVSRSVVPTFATSIVFVRPVSKKQPFRRIASIARNTCSSNRCLIVVCVQSDVHSNGVSDEILCIFMQRPNNFNFRTWNRRRQVFRIPSRFDCRALISRKRRRIVDRIVAPGKNFDLRILRV